MKNIRHRKSNIENPTMAQARRHWALDVGCGMWDVGCSVLIFAIRIYRLMISPAQIFLFGPTAGCRFTPTCSQYAIDAICERGAVDGTILTVKRICRCHPFGGCGHDPVQKSGKRKAESGNILEHAT